MDCMNAPSLNGLQVGAGFVEELPAGGAEGGFAEGFLKIFFVTLVPLGAMMKRKDSTRERGGGNAFLARDKHAAVLQAHGGVALHKAEQIILHELASLALSNL
jgi:hypothetical protein